MKKGKKDILYLIIQILAGFLIVTTIVGVIFAQTDEARSQYIFNLLQWIGLFIVTFVPKIFKTIKLKVPDVIQIVFILFCICHFVLGELGQFYLHVNHWDSMLHFFGGVATAILGFCLVGIVNNSETTGVKLPPFFLASFAVCFTITVGVLWEVFEYGMDVIVGTNMQRFMDSVTGEVFVGQKALSDTMKDLILESCSAAGIALLYLLNTSFREKVSKWKIEKITKSSNEENLSI